ncbi:LLM class flavin-dependent oxidoreductase [Hydrogenophaga sp.]|uniref:LLM class flavin-dependent oxidoreductase n=1 Tax=Hydrogenophaga sp. TaxID=1904254 RepID=UPI00271792A0|nr:LLM class flavin-dependent oxidoreductase [Hydrogenophaga sp.]MDO9438471.1 LLM class flavin-dependent oxidoreductase [Hydrogenophaga sp.]
MSARDLPLSQLPAESPLGRALEQPFLLGLFLPIHNGGWTMSTLPRGTDWTFDYNARLTQRAEALGFDLVFGPAHWLSKGGFGGETHYRETSLDAFIATSALAAVTQRILLVSTIHILYGPWHPLHLAKFGATLDHIAGGRWGLNVVTGFRKDEWAMFGQQQIEHGKRYELANEFVEILLKLWSSNDNVSHQSPNWTIENAFVTPKPQYGRPVLVSATSSPAGIASAVRHADLVFITSPAGARIDRALAALPELNAAVKRGAAAVGRSVRTIINPMIICRDTEKEARDLYDAILARADEGAIEGFFQSHATGDSVSWRGHERAERTVGGNIQIIGTPEQVVDQLLQLKAAGCDGIQICFFDYASELEYFGERVLPLMHQAGLRVAI